MSTDSSQVGYVYKLTCLVTGMSYIGQTNTSLRERWRKHKARASSYTRRTDALLAAMQRYPRETDWSIVALYCVAVPQLRQREAIAIQEHATAVPAGYNLMTGQGHHVLSRSRISASGRGQKRSQEHRRRIGEATKRRWQRHPEVHKRVVACASAANEHPVMAIFPDCSIRFSSVEDAARKTKVSATRIREAACGRKHTAGGMVWRYG